ncbi:uncharacterized protein C8A04DRAFT_38581 [Dichotomopilus funicola]|uniref:GPI anchored serine-threonine rich protein n=1 Tax=Dichotomopilus funicola TaxID=1934379 RepID=A0AAN6UZH7_9PEZI|nr:hypothetical protein C8A04DRAFT_38581 [Dichotomopilus funicola]
MKAVLLSLAVLASSAMAQTSSACGADYIVESCLSSEKAKLATCDGKDYDCLCQSWKNILTCYNNCPNDSRLENDAGQRDIFCSYATQFASSSTAAPAKSTTAGVPAQSTGDSTDATATNTDGQAPTGTTSGNGGATGTNSAADLALNAGGVLAAVAGVMAVLL